MLNSLAYYSVAPWTYTALMKLHTLEHPHERQRTAQNPPVSPAAAMFARISLSELKCDELPVPGVCSVEGGDVALIWTVGLKQIEAIFGADRAGSFVFSEGDALVVDGEFVQHDTASLLRALKVMVAE